MPNTEELLYQTDKSSPSTLLAGDSNTGVLLLRNF